MNDNITGVRLSVCAEITTCPVAFLFRRSLSLGHIQKQDTSVSVVVCLEMATRV